MMPEPTPREIIRLSEVWDALASGAPSPDANDADLVSSIHQLEERAVTPIPPPQLMARVWEEITGTPLPDLELVLAPGVAIAVNGHAAANATAPVVAARERSRRVAFLSVYRLIALAVIGGMAGGFLTGIWTRIAMRVAGSLTVDQNRALLTENEAAVGHITFGGTLFLGLFGAVVGVAGGLLYVVLRRWLPGDGWKRPLVYGGALLAVFGFIVMDPTNVDYQLFGPTWLNVATFSLAYVVFGFTAGTMIDWLDRHVPRLAVPGRSRTRATLLVVVLAPFATIGGFTGVSVTLGLAGVGGILVALMVLALVIAILIPRWKPTLVRRLPRPEFVGYAALAVPSLIGLVLTVRAIADIMIG